MLQKMTWNQKAIKFLDSISTNGLHPSVPGGAITLYGSCYAYMAKHYLHCQQESNDRLRDFINSCRCTKTGFFIGPELQDFHPDPSAKHDLPHLLNHLACSAVLPVAQEMKIPIEPLTFAREWCSAQQLTDWQSTVNWKNAWFEGNNVLFKGQLLVYLRDVEKYAPAQKCLDHWFKWLNECVDPMTSLWGTNGFCSPMEAVYGGYHQLLVYWHENRPITNPKGLIDTVLTLQHADGGFNPYGNAGACEDVDCIDILINCYKRYQYKHPEIRIAVRRCVDYILGTQNLDGGFPYNRNMPQSHMGIPNTNANPNVSCTFPTWFRIHTLALCKEILPEHAGLKGVQFRFNTYLSMGWHKTPPTWTLAIDHTQRKKEAALLATIRRRALLKRTTSNVQSLRNKLKNLLKRITSITDRTTPRNNPN
jgi:hypothetical protein